jgi:hypothetical protein
VIVLLISYLIIETPFFTRGTADLMTDTTRICFSTLAFVFAYQYFRRGQMYFLFASGLLAGGAMRENIPNCSLLCSLDYHCFRH